MGTVTRWELTLVVVVGAACGSNGRGGVSSAQPAAASRTTVERDAPAVPEVGETIPVGSSGGSVAVLAFEGNVQAGRLFAPPPGRRHVAALVRGCAGPDEVGLVFDPAFFFVRLADATVYPPSADIRRPPLTSGRLRPGSCHEGWITFTVPLVSARSPHGPATTVVYDGAKRLEWTLAGQAAPSSPPGPPAPRRAAGSAAPVPIS